MIRAARYGLTAGLLAAAARMTWVVLADWAHNLATAITDTDLFTEEDD